MRDVLLNNRLMPFYGVAIKILHRVGFYTPLVWLTKFFIAEKGSQKTGADCCRILALSPSRFRGDLDVLEQTGAFSVLAIPEAWQNRIIYSFFNIEPTFEAVYQPSTSREFEAHVKLERFMRAFLPLLLRALKVDVLISAAVHYQSDYLWGSHASISGVPFVVFHRECFHTTQERRDFWIEKWKPTKKYVFDFCIFHNEVIRKNYADSGVFPLEKTASFGALRMDAFVKRYYKKYPPLPAKKRITLFSFMHAVGLGGKIPLWSPYDQPQGFTRMFEEVHVAFARFAEKHPDVECVLKPKWGGAWIDEFHKVFKRNNIDFKTLPNLKIMVDVDVHQLIEESNVVCGYGSTTLLEAGIIGRPVVITRMQEALWPEYENQIQMLSDLIHYDVAHNEAEFHHILERLLSAPEGSESAQAAREALFNKWISPVDASATENYAQCLKTIIDSRRHS